MAGTETAPVSTWEFDTRVRTNGVAELRGVRAVSADETWAVGSVVDKETRRRQALVARWTKDFGFVKPAPVDPGLDVRLFGVDQAGEDVWAVGSVSDAIGGGRPRIERFSRAKGEPAGEAVDAPSVDRSSELQAVAMVSPSEGWAVGGSGPAAGADLTKTLIMRWDGSAWRTVPSPNPGTLTNRLDAVTVRAADDVWAVGQCSSDDGLAEPLVLHWNGLTWNRVPVPRLVPGSCALLGVDTVGFDSVWVVGTSVVADPETGKLGRLLGVILRRDGSIWESLLTEPTPVTEMTGVAAVSGTDVWFSGYAKLPNGPETVHIGHWDGEKVRSELFGPLPQGHVASALGGIDAADNRMTAVGWLVPDHASDQQPAALLGRSGRL